jgi:hypothetical protein
MAVLVSIHGSKIESRSAAWCWFSAADACAVDGRTRLAFWKVEVAATMSSVATLNHPQRCVQGEFSAAFSVSM